MSSYLSISTDLNQLLTAHLKAEGIVIKGTWSILKVQCVMGLWHPTVDGSEIRQNHQLREVGSWNPIIYGVLYIPGGWPWDFWTINSMTLLPVNLVMVFQISVCESPDSASRLGTRWTSEKLQRHETGTIATIIQQASSNHWKTIQLQHFISKPPKVLFFVKIIFKTLHQHLCLSTCHQIFHREKQKSIPRVFIPKLSTIPKQIPRFFAPLDPQGVGAMGIPTGDHDEVHVLVPLAFAGLNGAKGQDVFNLIQRLTLW